MSSQINIAGFIHALSDMPRTDMLVNLPENADGLVLLRDLPKDPFSVELDPKWRTIWQTANKFRLEADVNSLCLVYGTAVSRIGDREIRSPLLIVPVSWEYTRISNTLRLELNEELAEINPYIKFIYAEFNKEPIAEFPGDLSLAEKLDWAVEQLRNSNFEGSVSPGIIIGNFHYHRFHILRELEGIERSEHKNPLIRQLLGNDFESPQNLGFGPGLITPADADQLRVFNTLNENNVLLQGPPGTGKSQVLINILGKSLDARLKILVVSEKRVALDVLVKKLAELQLDPFAFVVHSQSKSKDLLKHLKATWDLLESQDLNSGRNLRLSEQLYANLQLLLDRLNTPGYFAGVSYREFQALLAETPVRKEAFSTLAPSVDEWLKNKDLIREIDRRLNGFSRLKGIKPAFFESWNGDRIVKDCIENLALIRKKLEDLNTFRDLEKLIAVLGRCQLVENEQYKAYSHLLSKPKEWKKFQKQLQRFRELKEKLRTDDAETLIWKQVPSRSQLESWEQASSWLQLRKRKRAITALLKDPSVLPDVALSNWRNYLEDREELKALESYFGDLGLQADQHALDLGMLYAASLERESGTLLSEIAAWPRFKRLSVIESGTELNQLRSQLIRCFNIPEEDNLYGFLKQKADDFVSLSGAFEQLKSLPASFFLLVNDVDSWEEMQELVLYSSLKRMESLYPELVRFSGSLLHERLEEIIFTENREFVDAAQAIRFQVQKRFEAFEALLRTPAQKLNAEQKELKARLKKGKSLLVKEFAKSRNYLTIRSLLASEAKEWIQLLTPVWLATPNQVADHFPLEPELFDLVLFDEASQIPLPNALGSLFRSKRALVAGDEQQMAPSNYFGKNFGFHDLLHQASYYFERVALHHHYRSESSELIRFSNKHFYKDELIVYPSPESKQALFHHFVESGVFDDRKNEVEAKRVAGFLEEFSGWETQTIGITAFSEEQLKAIWAACSARVQELITIGREENTLFFKALENVQGDEADILIISLGYGRDQEGTFRMRFGPLNQSNGYKRLNVLLTRAKQEMHFFSSVKSADFELSDNESVNLLRRFLLELEEGQIGSHSPVFPYGLEAESIAGNTVHFKDSFARVPAAADLVTFHRVMKQRGWKLNY